MKTAGSGQAQPVSPDYPVREYVCAMAGELSRMARWDGDEKLATLLEVAAEIAGRPAPRPAGAPA